MDTTQATTTTATVDCEHCGQTHLAEYSHQSQWAPEVPVYAVVCTGQPEWVTDYYTTEGVTFTEHLAVKAGDTVVGKPIGQKRRQTVYVHRVDEALGLVFGYLVSKKYENTWRGQANLFITAVEEVQAA